MNKLDINLLNEYKANGLLRCQKHNTLPLLIWNYTEKVQFDDLFDPITTICRGLVTDTEGNIVARAFPKFFNIEQNKHIETDDFEVYEKLDGSLGILFNYQNSWIIATRGSFHSEQANKALEILSRKGELALDRKLSYLFEIIYPENRIIVNYGDKEALVLLGVIDKTGKEYPICFEELKRDFEACKSYSFKDYKSIQALNTKNEEGFVVRFSNGSRCKIKFADYVELHRIKSQVSKKSVWELFSNDVQAKFEEYLSVIPDEFHEKVKGWFSELTKAYDSILSQCLTDYLAVLEFLPDCEDEKQTKKAFALLVKDHPHKNILFAIFDKKNGYKMICDLIKPVAAQPLMFDKE